MEINNDRLKKIKPEYLNKKFDKFLKRDDGLKVINNIKDLAESLREGNRSLNDCTFVYCQGNEEIDMHAYRLVQSETRNQVLCVRSQELMQELRMEPGKYYCYYKPSYVNGFAQFVGQDIDFPYLQAFEGICRDEFIPNEEFINSEEFKEELKQTNGIQT